MPAADKITIILVIRAIRNCLAIDYAYLRAIGDRLPFPLEQTRRTMPKLGWL
jgi:hypothetical protein